MNAILDAIGDAIFAPVAWLGPVGAILVLAVLVAAGSLVVFKRTSDQEKIRRGKGPMKAHLLGVFLFRHDLRLVLRSLLASFRGSFTNLRFLALPMAVMIVPLVVIFVQMDLRLGRAGLAPDATTVLRVHVRPGADLDGISLSAPDGVMVETPGVRVRDRVRDLWEVDWRLRAVAPGEHDLVIRTAKGEVTKRVSVGAGLRPVSPVRGTASLGAALFTPGEPALPGDGDVTKIELAYPEATYAFLGIDWAWWTLFLVAMVLALYALRGPLGVDF